MTIQEYQRNPFVEENVNLIIELINEQLGDVFDRYNLDQLDKVMRQWDWREEGSAHQPAGISVGHAFYGEHPTSTQAIHDRACQMVLKYRPDLVTQHGHEEVQGIIPHMDKQFEELFQITEGLTEDQYLLTEVLVACELITDTLDRLNKKPEEIDLFVFATSMPSNPNVEQIIAQAVGIRPTALKFIYKKACDSTGSALFDIHNGKYDDQLTHIIDDFDSGRFPATVAILSLEDGNRLSHKGGDPVSAQLFSTAAAWTILEYRPTPQGTQQLTGSSLQLLTGVSEEKAVINIRGREVPASCLKYFNPMLDNPAWAAKTNVVQTAASPQPDHGWAVQMSPAETALYFAYGAVEITHQAINKLKQDYPHQAAQILKQVSRVIFHHPSPTIINNLTAKLRKIDDFSPSLKIQSVITEGNAPAVTIPIALQRQLNEIQAGEICMFLSFGAEGSFTCGFYVIGGHGCDNLDQLLAASDESHIERENS